jgi:hypothetical protein
MPAPHAQVAATHELPPLQTVPHDPQLALSLCVSTQRPSHDVCPPGHCGASMVASTGGMSNDIDPSDVIH